MPKTKNAPLFDPRGSNRAAVTDAKCDFDFGALAVPTKVINTAGTFNLKQGTSRLYSIFCASVGTAFTIRVLDGPDSAGNTQAKLGAAAITPPGVGYLLNPNQEPMILRDGLQVITAGTPGEYELEFD